MKNINIFSKDDYKIFDKLENQKNKEPKLGVQGWVQVYFDSKIEKNQLVDGKLHHEGSNLVTAQGRSFVSQKIFNVAGTPDYRGFSLSHFAVGGGGATVSGSDVTLLGPFICDTYLQQPIKLSTTYLNEPSSYVGTKPLIHNYQGAVKPITTNGSITLESEDYEGGEKHCSYNTKVKCTCIVPAGEPAGLNPGQSTPINEAGLYFVNGTVAKMFSRICFAPKWKEFESILTIVWYILC